jgi:hypothetical protein
MQYNGGEFIGGIRYDDFVMHPHAPEAIVLLLELCGYGHRKVSVAPPAETATVVGPHFVASTPLAKYASAVRL